LRHLLVLTFLIALAASSVPFINTGLVNGTRTGSVSQVGAIKIDGTLDIVYGDSRDHTSITTAYSLSLTNGTNVPLRASRLMMSMHEVVADLLGLRVRKVFYDCLQVERGFRREAIPEHQDSFQQFLDENFGKASRTLTRAIAKRFYTKLGWSFVEMPQYDLLDYFNMAQKRATKSTSQILVAIKS